MFSAITRDAVMARVSAAMCGVDIDGVILGQLLYKPNPRIIKAAAGFGVLYAAWKFPIPVSLSVFLVMFPFPFAISYGSSNTIFVFIITAMWLAQIVLRTERPVGRTPLDLHISVLLSIYLLSFGNESFVAECVAR